MECGGKLPHSKFASLHKKSFTKNKKLGASVKKMIRAYYQELSEKKGVCFMCLGWMLCFLLVCCLLFTACSSLKLCKQGKFERFFVWSMPTTDELATVSAELGVTDVVISHGNRRQKELAKQHQFRMYPCIMPTVALWKQYNKDAAAPLQVMLPEEEAIHKFRWIDRAEGTRNPSHYGGEPVFDPSTGRHLTDPLSTRLLCLNHPEVRTVFEKQILEYCAIPEYDGIAFDFIGYMNGRGCYCEHCRQLYQQYLEQSGKADSAAVQDAFYLEQLVNFCNYLHRFIKEKRPQMLTTSHLYPVFLPKPLYGCLLEYDFTQETAAWYFPWSEEKILDYSRAISRYPGGVHFIGYYDHNKRPAFPEKTAARIELELSTMLRGGARHLSVCGFQDVLESPEIRQAFKKYLRGAK
jgi:hypothetical protein